MIIDATVSTVNPLYTGNAHYFSAELPPSAPSTDPSAINTHYLHTDSPSSTSTAAHQKNNTYSAIPQAMRERAQWVVGKYGKLQSNGKRAKVPFDAKTGKAASAADPTTWATYDQAVETYQRGGYDFISFMLDASDPFTFIDLDDCIRNGEIDAGAYATIQGFNSYSERSISGTGIHIIIEGRSLAGRKRGNVEVYSERRQCVMTGSAISGFTKIEARQTILDAFYSESFPALEPAPAPTTTTPSADLPSSDDDLIKIIRNSKQADKFSHLWDGNLAGYSSPSEADLALCAVLAFWTGGDTERIDRLFRQSGLYRADKWDRAARTGETYGQGTVSRAIGQVSKHYQPAQTAQSDVARLIYANRAFIIGLPMRSATQRVMLALLTHFEKANAPTTPVSSRHVSDLTGLSHRSVQMELRLLCPQTRTARIKRLIKDMDKVKPQLGVAMNAIDAQDALRVLRPREQASITAKRGYQGEAAVMAEVVIYLQNKIERCQKELKFYAKNEAHGNTFDLLSCDSKCDGTAFANAYTLETLQNDPNELCKRFPQPLNTIAADGADSKSVSIGHCGNLLQSSFAELRFVETHMSDDAFAKAPPTKTDPWIKLAEKNGADVAKLERLTILLSPEDKLKSFGLSAPRVFAHLDTTPGATVEDLVMATGLAERTVRSVLKNTGVALVEQGYLPLIEATKIGRKHTYRLAHDWHIRLDDLRGDLATNGLVVARAIHHAGERIKRIAKFLENSTRDGRCKLDEQTRLQYEQIRVRAHTLVDRLSGGAYKVAKREVLDISEQLLVVEAKIDPARLARIAAAGEAARKAIEDSIRRNQGAAAVGEWERQRAVNYGY